LIPKKEQTLDETIPTPRAKEKGKGRERAIRVLKNQAVEKGKLSPIPVFKVTESCNST